ncbi:hypothetical protein [Lichenibacterium dinghuense]|uniref:hypothetical protein n=1 Tax=Lichenibacterium dinghuense TaxID=2895977 RepID=UPI001F32B1E5|nr:hypothetical protein [Lichenibacterium sp. 6Y81]
MAITITHNAPASGPLTIMRALGDLNPSTDRLGGARIDISAPLGLYRLGLDDIDSEHSFGHALFVGWRYLLEGGGHGVGAADVVPSEGGQARFTSLARNEQADFLLRAAHVAEEIASGLSGDCEARILIVPSLYVSALWLTADPPVFIPFLDPLRPIRTVEDVAVRPDFTRDLLARAKVARDRRPEREIGMPSP